MKLLGVVRNIVAFGAFIDVGVDTDGPSPSIVLNLFQVVDFLDSLIHFLLRTAAHQRNKKIRGVSSGNSSRFLVYVLTRL